MPTFAPPRSSVWFPGSSSFMRAGSTHEAEMIFSGDPTNHPVPRPALPQTGEVRLVIAVLLQARDDLAWRHVRTRQGFCFPSCKPCEARTWIVDERSDLFSFRWCCELLGLDAAAVRRTLTRVPVGSTTESCAPSAL